jgi:phosphoribosylformimino-5-aminoimidazole carboxamide ribotide isomerase
MIIYPAIDLRNGRCVRLRHGDPEQETVFGNDAAEIARRWQAAGAVWLHVVNLDGAFQSGLGALTSPNVTALHQILDAVEIGVQFGGGIRSLDDMDLLLELGVDRLVLGTTAVQRPNLLKEAIREFGAEKLVIGIDAKDERVATHGWTQTSDLHPIDFGRQLSRAGVQRVVYTDISRDGTMEGVNLEATVRLARETGLRVIASGGVATIDDVRALRAQEEDGIEGTIIGRALYAGAIDLSAAIQAALGIED